MSAYQDHVTRGLDELTEGLIPFVESELRSVYRDAWLSQIKSHLREDRHDPDEPIHWDSQSLLTVMWDQWNAVFRRRLSLMERSLVGEIREFRNRWAHRSEFDFEDTYRTLDSIYRLLRAVGASQAQVLELHKRELLQDQFGKQVNQELQQKTNRRSRWQAVIINAVCCLLIISQLFYQYGMSVWSLALLCVVGFVFLTYRQLAPVKPGVGVRECPRCRKVIYTVRCPYCEPAVGVAHSSAASEASAEMPSTISTVPIQQG